jgi:hypothetical protein
MNARTRGLTVLAALTLAAACGRPEAPAAEAEPSVEAARAMETERGGVALSDLDRGVTTARAMREMPGAADSILAANGFTRPGFDSLLYAIAADSALARAYTESIR